MDKEENKNSIQDNVLKAIEAGKVTMKPRWHFVIKTSLFVLGTILLCLAIVYLASFIIFILRQTGVLFIPGFGFHGIVIFLRSAPWLLILMAVSCIILLQVLVKKYAFSYGRPLIYTALGIIVLVVVGGVLVEMTPIHRGLFQQAEQHRLPFGGQMYLQYGEPRLDYVTPGTIDGITDNIYELRTRREENINIIVTPQTRIPFGIVFKVGDHVVVLGKRDGDTVTAEGINPFDDHLPPMPR